MDSPPPSKPSTAPPTDPPLTRVGAYQVTGVISSGGYGTVYSAEHDGTQQKAAIKVLHSALVSTTDIVQRFLQEAQLVDALSHPAIIQLFESGTLQDGRPYLVMEHFQGRSLAQALHAKGQLSLEEAVSIMDPICSALSAVHARGVVHRDIKASNILVGPEGSGLVKLIDFGIAKVLRPDAGGPLTAVGQRMGTPAAMAPEQILGQGIDGRADIYALGVLLFRMLTARFPFVSSTLAESERLHLFAPPPAPSLYAPIPQAVDAVVRKCLEKQRDHRYATVEDLLEGLKQAERAQRSPDGDSSPQRDIRTVGMLVETLPQGSEEELEDALFLADSCLDDIEHALQLEGFVITARAGSVLLGTRPLHETGPAGHAQKRAAAALAESLGHRQTEQVQLRITTHLASGLYEEGPMGLELVGGPISDFTGWASAGEAGVYSFKEWDTL